jgi:hypothetical protein
MATQASALRIRKPRRAMPRKPQPRKTRRASQPKGETPSSRSEEDSISGVTHVIKRYYPALLDAFLAFLAVFGAMSFKGRTKPLSLIFEGSSGSGKTALIQTVFSGESSTMSDYVYRSDKFSPRSFVSHAANKKESELQDIDLLPKLENKVFISKELATLFRGKEADLQENFSILISVLDGKGWTSDSGTRGKRGYERSILFNWVGGTTPLPASTHRLMSQLGTRLLFYEIPAIEPSEADLLVYARKDDADTAEDECREVVTDFLLKFFRKHPVGTVSSDSISISEEHLRVLVRWVRFLCAGRSEVKFEKSGTNWEPVAAMPPEAPWKIVGYFKELARGRALICGRQAVDDSDLDLISHVTMSSIPGHLRPLIRALTKQESIDTTQAAAHCRVSPPTARHYLKELALLGIATLTKGTPANWRGADDGTRPANSIMLATDYSWLSTPLKSNRVCVCEMEKGGRG